LNDFRDALRGLRNSPGFALTCIGILAFGIGANAAIFSVVHAVILKRLPYVDPERMVFVWERFPNMPDPPGGRIQVCRRNYESWKSQNTVFSGMAAFRQVSFTQTGIAAPVRVPTAAASTNFFSLLAIQPHLGRLFRPDEEQRGRDLVAVLADRYFEQRFGRDPSCIGKTIVLDGAGYTVIGVLPPEFHLPATWEGQEQLKPEVWVPLSRLWRIPDYDIRRQLLVMARLKPGVTLAAARTEMAGISERLAKANPKLNEGWTSSVFPFSTEDTSPALHRALYALLGAVAFVLLLACANLANLTLARATHRTRDVAVRLALGAERRHVITHLLAESILIAMAGAAVGLLLAHWGIRAMLWLQPAEIQRTEFIGLNLPVFAFACALAVATGLLVGLAPALSVARTDVLPALKMGGGWGASAAHDRKRRFLVALEVALVLVLVTGAGFMGSSYYRIVTSDLGYATDHLLTMDIDLPESRYKLSEQRSRFNHQLLERLRALPGVAFATVSDNIPLHRISVADFRIAGWPEPKPGAAPMADFANVGPDYFATMGMRLRAGRVFTDADLALNERGQGGVVMINEALSRRYWPAEDPIGRRILSNDKPYEIVGVVSDYRQMGAENELRPQLFWAALSFPGQVIVILRAHGNPLHLVQAVKREIWAVDKELPIEHVRTMRQMADEWLAQRRFNTVILVVFTVLGLMLATTGIYSVLAHIVSSRTHEIGIRMALGAHAGAVLALVFRQSLTPVAAGAAAGIVGVLVLGRFLESLLFGVHASDPLTITAMTGMTLLVAAAAIWFPARRAARVDPALALREE
jgi:putative ABC transport system permease protein